MVLLAALLGCGRPPTLGMRIVADVACEAPDGSACQVSNLAAPCRCNPHQFDLDAGEVEVSRDRLRGTPDPAVVASVEYTSAADLDLCGRDLVVGAEPATVPSVEGEPLYEVDADGALVPLPDAPLVADAVDSLTFEYPVATGTVREVHVVDFRQALSVDAVASAPCCSAVSRTGLGPAALALLSLAALRRP